MAHTLDLIVIDPLTTIMPGTDRNDEGDTRDALTPLIKLAERRNVAVHRHWPCREAEWFNRVAQRK